MTTIQPVGLDDPTAAFLLAALGVEYELRYGTQDEMATTTRSEFEPPTEVSSS